mmetsp:Transcript_26538/g.33133  ORF Transcript_26538/g.33133 Transcript_26538/m.33133 type:complete len:252 (-) Transcript_26538:417-1172(-)
MKAGFSNEIKNVAIAPDYSFFTCSLLTLTLSSSLFIIGLLIRNNKKPQNLSRRARSLVRSKFEDLPKFDNLSRYTAPQESGRFAPECGNSLHQLYVQVNDNPASDNLSTSDSWSTSDSLSNLELSLNHLDDGDGYMKRLSMCSEPAPISAFDSPSDSPTIKLKRSVSFKESVQVVCIEKAEEFSPQEREACWLSEEEAQEALLRNSIEAEAELRNGGRVLEEHEMFRCEESGELFHPAFIEFLKDNATDLE